MRMRTTYGILRLTAATLLSFSGAALAPGLAAAQSDEPPPRVAPPGACLIDPAPIPAGYTCAGNCGTSDANGVVPLSPIGSAMYEWISTSGGTSGVGALPSGNLGYETDGSRLATPVFTANAGAVLNFYFNYVTSDGAGYADYAWAELFTSTGSPVALLFTSRTVPTGSIIPGTGMPAPMATLTPALVPITSGGPAWAPLGGYSGLCYSAGCGYTGWTQATYTIPTAGSYYLQIGVTNWLDSIYDSGLAMDGVMINGKPIQCGDGDVQGSEQCDDGASNGTCGHACSSKCTLHWCGDGVVDANEQCDLGCQNGVAGSACTATCTIVASPTPPKCALTAIIAGPPKQLKITVQDPDNGLKSVAVTEANNVTVAVPTFTAGDKSAMVVVATKVDQSKGASVALRITDVNGAITDCDPVVPGDPDAAGDAGMGCSIARGKSGLGIASLIGSALVGLALLRRRQRRA